jgi:hypothetical protein
LIVKKRTLLITTIVAVLGLSLGIALANGGGAAIQRKVFGGGVKGVSGGNVSLRATLGQPAVGASSGGNVSLGAGYWHGLGYDETKCGLAAGNTYHYNQTFPVKVVVDTLGTIHCLRVLRADGDHPNATTALQTGCSWTLTATDSGGAAAVGFSLTLTLPATFTPDGDDKLCRYTGSGQVWDCAATSFDAGNKTITRSGVVQLSDWATGDDVGSTAVTVRSLAARSPGRVSTGLLVALVWGLSAGVVGVGSWWWVKSRRRK